MIKTAQRQDVLYRDFRTDFIAHPVTGILQLVSNEDAVKQSIKAILLTGKYERHWDPDFGAGLQKYLFEPVSSATEMMIKDEIKYAIQKYEPRAELEEVYVSVDPDNNGYNATIVFRVINKTDPITLNVLLSRVR